MKQYQITPTVIFILIAFSSLAQKSIPVNLHQLVQKKGIEVYQRELSLLNEKGYEGIHLSKDYGEGVAWLKDVDFSEGILEFDVRGENIQQHSFVGIAFHGQNDTTFEAIYLRPFRFRETDEELRKHSIQYISLPTFTWRVLRAQFPGTFEAAIDPSPDPNGWVRVRIVIKDSMISTYINGDAEPSLVVRQVTQFKKGKIGFYVADTSGGDFANISITKTN